MRTLKFQRKKNDGSLEQILDVDVLTPHDLTLRGLVKREELGDVVEDIAVPEVKVFFDFVPPKNGLLVASARPNPETESMNPSRFSVKAVVGGVEIPMLENVAGTVSGGSTWESMGNLTWEDVGRVREPFANSLNVTKGLTYKLMAGSEYVSFKYIANKEVPYFFGDLDFFQVKNLKTFSVDPFNTTGILPVLFSSHNIQPINVDYTPIVTIEWVKPFIHAPFVNTVIQDVRPEGFNILFVESAGNLAVNMFTEAQRNQERDFRLFISVPNS